MIVQQQPLIAHDGMDGLDATLHGALNAALDDAMAGGIGDGGQSIEDVMNAQTDLMSGLIGGPDDMDAENLFGDMGSGMGFRDSY